MMLVTSMMTKAELSDTDVQKAREIISREFDCESRTAKFHYDDQQFFTADIDLLDIEFSKDTLYEGINKLISAYEEIMNVIPEPIDFIAANDDTSTEISKYEENTNNVKDFGLFVTKRDISELVPYYFSENCRAYLNLDHVSFGVYESSV